MAHKDYNKKVPKTKVCNQKTKPKYGHVHGEWDECGGHKWVYRNAEEGKKTFSQELKPSGGYKVTEADDDVKEGHFEVSPGNKHFYAGAGMSVHADGHYDFNTESTCRIEAGGDASFVTAQDGLFGMGGKKIELVKDGSAKVIAGGSSGTHELGVNGDYRTTIKGKKYTKVEGDTVTGHEGKHIMLNNDDAAFYFDKNWDAFAKQKLKLESKQAFQAFSQDTMFLQSDKDMTANSGAKYSVKSKEDYSVNSQAKVIITASSSANITAQEITITADTKITLKVGSNKIEISSSGITIDAGGGKVDITATGDVKTKGATTKIQGGGLTAPPTTFI